MKALKFPIIPITIFLALGIVFGSYFKFDFSFILASTLISISFFTLFHFFKKGKKSVYLFGFITYLLAFQLGIALEYFHYEKNHENHYTHLVSNNEKVFLEGIVKNTAKPSKTKNKYIVEITTINAVPVNGKTLIYVPKESTLNLKPGMHFSVVTKLYLIKDNLNPYQFNYAKYIEKQNVFHQIYASAEELNITSQEENFDFHVYEIREKLIRSFQPHQFDLKIQGVINALLFGQRILLDQETIQSYSNAGVIHILAISGLHVGIIYIIIGFLFKPLNRIKNGKNINLLLVIGTLWLFAFLSGLSPSVTRAVLMFSILALGKHFNQQTTTINTIAVSALILLCYNPNYIFDVGFQLSYAAVISIVLLNPYFKYFHFSKNTILKYSTDIVLVSLAAQIGVLPLSIYYFNQFPILFLAANIIVIPLTTLVLLLGILTLFFNFISIGIASVFGILLSKIIQIMNQYITWIAQFDSFVIKNISFSLLLCLVSYLFIFSFIYLVYKPKKRNLKYVLMVLFAMQITYISTKYKENNSEELIVFGSKNSLITIKQKNQITAFTNNPEENTESISQYKRGTFSEDVSILPLQNILLFKNTKVLIVDSLATYKISQKPDVILLTQGTRVNLERLIKLNQPKVIIADNSNSKYKVERWKATCLKEKIPFHSTYEKGLYIIRK
ncbi:ComEC/Rec2 family competence protein [Flavobacterium sp.]|uniref:ComEC/Rec2 family competence protein n=1 Tax=Flavobacterium sp. TaxID=239 RepID=UPI002A83393B|nr:ComEC/Rec2 family competence protein [Flavobacterium sp.]